MWASTLERERKMREQEDTSSATVQMLVEQQADERRSGTRPVDAQQHLEPWADESKIAPERGQTAEAAPLAAIRNNKIVGRAKGESRATGDNLKGSKHSARQASSPPKAKAGALCCPKAPGVAGAACD